MRDHGGNIDEAIAGFGGPARDWIDLSTGINRQPYPVPPVPATAWTDLPTRAEQARLSAAAARAYDTTAAILPVAGAQAAIQWVPRLAAPGTAKVLAPTYNEHAAALRQAGWAVAEVDRLADLAGADLAVVVNPNNPDGRHHAVDDLLALSRSVARLVVDESFIDATPDLSLAAHAGRAGVLVLRSFGKFYGLAGLRLGCVIGPPDDLADLEALVGPWTVSGIALAIGQAALADDAWRRQTMARLARESVRLDRLADAAGWMLIGGTALFRTYQTADAAAVRARLARHRIWTRTFPYAPTWLRLGLPGTEHEWQRLAAALGSLQRSAGE